MANALLSEAEVEHQITLEVADEARDMVASLDLRLQQIRAGVLDGGDAAQMFARDIHNLRSKSRTVNIPGLASMTHRLDDYLADIDRINDAHVADLQTYSDRLSALLDGEEVPPDVVASVVRELPHKKNFDLSDITITDIEVTLVLPQRSAARVVERELAACGYRVSIVLNAFEALELIVESRPDLVITTMVMPGLSGVDLACALAAMPATKGMPVAVLTSLERDHPDLKDLPMSTGLIRRGGQFGDDLADVLQRFQIT